MIVKTAKGAQLKKPPLMPVFLTQGLVLTVLTVFLWFVADSVVAYSAALGGFVSVGPNVYFARWAFRFAGARATAQVIHAFYLGETGKFVLTAMLFACVFAWIQPINAVAVFLSYGLMAVLNGALSVVLLKPGSFR
ncbi:ATP synthase subunit I [bacterium]|nr:ATP synthase subunit I [bacterium]